VIDLCDRWHKLPSQVLAEDASVLRLLGIVALGRPPQPPEDQGGGDMW
jgi:hypothetical protein